MSLRLLQAPLGLLLPTLAACSSSPPLEASRGAAEGGVSGTAAGTGLGGAMNMGGALAAGTPGVVVVPVAGGASAMNPGTATCTADFAKTELQPVYLAFAFDVSGSMGKLDHPYHDPTLKWDPVVRATKAFFADTTTSRLRASLTFFPAEEKKCDEESYLTPDVAMTALPSDAFAKAIDDITPTEADDWRGGTPTLAVLEGTFAWMSQQRASDPSGKYAVVLVTDGYPQGCDDEDDDIEAVAKAVEQAAGELPTYVIGVANPPGGPDTVTNLNRLAQAGSTATAFLISTGDPENTARDFKTAIDAIRDQAVTCEAPIPENPGGKPFDPERVNVTLSSGGSTTRLGYDQSCAVESAFRFDESRPARPHRTLQRHVRDAARRPYGRTRRGVWLRSYRSRAALSSDVDRRT